jgi:hypothetical protein
MNCEKLKAEIDKLILYDSEKSSLHSNVCLICGKLVKPKEMKLVGLKTFLKYAFYLTGSSSIPISLHQCYRLHLDEIMNIPDNEILKDCLLSARSKLVHSYKKGCAKVMCCQESV